MIISSRTEVSWPKSGVGNNISKYFINFSHIWRTSAFNDVTFHYMHENVHCRVYMWQYTTSLYKLWHSMAASENTCSAELNSDTIAKCHILQSWNIWDHFSSASKFLV